MDEKLHILQHALGVDQYGNGVQYRNHFVTGEGSDDFADCKALVEMGLMADRGVLAISGGSNCFNVTRAGKEYVATHSPAPPPAPKLTPSQRRYQEYMDSDCGLTYAEWLGVDTKCESDYSGNYRYTNGKHYPYLVAGPWRRTKKEAKSAYKAMMAERKAA